MVTVKVITQLTQLDLSKLTKPFSFKFNHLGYDPRLLVKDFPYEDVKNEISFYVVYINVFCLLVMAYERVEENGLAVHFYCKTCMPVISKLHTQGFE